MGDRNTVCRKLCEDMLSSMSKWGQEYWAIDKRLTFGKLRQHLTFRFQELFRVAQEAHPEKKELYKVLVRAFRNDLELIQVIFPKTAGPLVADAFHKLLKLCEDVAPLAAVPVGVLQLKDRHFMPAPKKITLFSEEYDNEAWGLVKKSMQMKWLENYKRYLNSPHSEGCFSDALRVIEERLIHHVSFFESEWMQVLRVSKHYAETNYDVDFLESLNQLRSAIPKFGIIWELYNDREGGTDLYADIKVALVPYEKVLQAALVPYQKVLGCLACKSQNDLA
eukprot:1334073-Rhodomonas_salina.2